MKKFISAVLISALAFASLANAAWEDGYADDMMIDELRPFTDVQTGHQNMRAINMAYQFDTVQGYPDGTFGPDREINRAELVKIMVAETTEADPDPALYHNCFNDVNAEWFAPYVCYAKEQGWIQGYEDDTFRPAQNVNRVEALKIIMEAGIPQSEWPNPTDVEKAITLPVDIEAGQWYEGYARMAIVKELVDGQHVTQDNQGNVYYYPGDDMTRKEVVEMVWRITIWVVQRMSYAEAIAEVGCFQLANPQLETETQEVKDGYVLQIFDLYGFDDESGALAMAKYDGDNISDAHIETFVIEKCGPGVEYDNWMMNDGAEG